MKAFVILQSSDGTERKIPTGKCYKKLPGEITKVLYEQEPAQLGLGDVIAKVTTVIGIKPCEGCKQRQEALNNWWFKLANSLGK